MITDRELDNYYSKNYFGTGLDYFDDVPEDYDPDEEDFDPECDGWEKPSERADYDW